MPRPFTRFTVLGYDVSGPCFNLLTISQAHRVIRRTNDFCSFASPVIGYIWIVRNPSLPRLTENSAPSALYRMSATNKLHFGLPLPNLL